MKKITLTDEEKLNRSKIDLHEFGDFSVSFEDDAVEVDGITISVKGTYFKPGDYKGKDDTLYINLANKTEDDIECWKDVLNAEWDSIDI